MEEAKEPALMVNSQQQHHRSNMSNTANRMHMSLNNPEHY